MSCTGSILLISVRTSIPARFYSTYTSSFSISRMKTWSLIILDTSLSYWPTRWSSGTWENKLKTNSEAQNKDQLILLTTRESTSFLSFRIRDSNLMKSTMVAVWPSVGPVWEEVCYLQEAHGRGSLNKFWTQLSNTQTHKATDQRPTCLFWKRGARQISTQLAAS